MKLAPITTARRDVAARAMMARESPSVRSVCIVRQVHAG
jgi:hypothetical protein